MRSVFLFLWLIASCAAIRLREDEDDEDIEDISTGDHGDHGDHGHHVVLGDHGQSSKESPPPGHEDTGISGRWHPEVGEWNGALRSKPHTKKGLTKGMKAQLGTYSPCYTGDNSQCSFCKGPLATDCTACRPGYHFDKALFKTGMGRCLEGAVEKEYVCVVRDYEIAWDWSWEKVEWCCEHAEVACNLMYYEKNGINRGIDRPERFEGDTDDDSKLGKWLNHMWFRNWKHSQQGRAHRAAVCGTIAERAMCDAMAEQSGSCQWCDNLRGGTHPDGQCMTAELTCESLGSERALSSGGISDDGQERRCHDTAPDGATDSYGETCDAYTEDPKWCDGWYDYSDDDFTPADMCCACGGGGDGQERRCQDMAPDGATDSYGETCDEYTKDTLWCDDAYDYSDDDFTADDMCCACGGGYEDDGSLVMDCSQRCMGCGLACYAPGAPCEACSNCGESCQEQCDACGDEDMQCHGECDSCYEACHLGEACTTSCMPCHLEHCMDCFLCHQNSQGGDGCHAGCVECDGPGEHDCSVCEDGSPPLDDDGDGYGRCDLLDGQKEPTSTGNCPESNNHKVEGGGICCLSDWLEWSPCCTDDEKIGERWRRRDLIWGDEVDCPAYALDNSVGTDEFSNDVRWQMLTCEGGADACHGHGKGVMPKLDCKVSEWSEWDDCTGVTCEDPGVQFRRRHVEEPPAHGGVDCPASFNTEIGGSWVQGEDDVSYQWRSCGLPSYADERSLRIFRLDDCKLADKKRQSLTQCRADPDCTHVEPNGRQGFNIVHGNK